MPMAGSVDMQDVSYWYIDSVEVITHFVMTSLLYTR